MKLKVFGEVWGNSYFKVITECSLIFYRSDDLFKGGT